MPTAVFASIVAVEFDIRPELVTGVTLSIVIPTVLLRIPGMTGSGRLKMMIAGRSI
jgi:hypothetical protein